MKQKFVIVGPQEGFAKREDSLITSGFPWVTSILKSRSQGHELKLVAPSDFHAFYEYFPQVTTVTSTLPDSLLFRVLGNVDIPDFQEYRESVLKVDFAGHIYSIKSTFEIMRRLPLCHTVKFYLGERAQLATLHPDDLQEDFDLLPIYHVKFLSIALSMEFVDDNKKLKSVFTRQFNLLLRMASHLLPMLEDIEVFLPGEAKYFENIKNRLPMWRKLKHSYDVQIVNGTTRLHKIANKLPLIVPSPTPSPSPTQTLKETNLPTPPLPEQRIIVQERIDSSSSPPPLPEQMFSPPLPKPKIKRRLNSPPSSPQISPTKLVSSDGETDHHQGDFYGIKRAKILGKPLFNTPKLIPMEEDPAICMDSPPSSQKSESPPRKIFERKLSKNFRRQIKGPEEEGELDVTESEEEVQGHLGKKKDLKSSLPNDDIEPYLPESSSESTSVGKDKVCEKSKEGSGALFSETGSSDSGSHSGRHNVNNKSSKSKQSKQKRSKGKHRSKKRHRRPREYKRNSPEPWDVGPKPIVYDPNSRRKSGSPHKKQNVENGVPKRQPQIQPPPPCKGILKKSRIKVEEILKKSEYNFEDVPTEIDEEEEKHEDTAEEHKDDVQMVKCKERSSPPAPFISKFKSIDEFKEQFNRREPKLTLPIVDGVPRMDQLFKQVQEAKNNN